MLCFALPRAWAQDLENLKSVKPVTFRGALNTGFQAYHVYGIDPRSANPMWNVSGSASLGLYGFDIPMSFTVGRQGNNVSYPAFKQFGASPHYKWLTVHGGWRNMNFSPYTLAGHTFLGAGIELNPGKFRFAAMYGRFRQAREVQDTAATKFFPPSFKRTGYGVKIGVGRNDRYFDLIYFRAKDDPKSLATPLKDSSLTAGENAVFGYATRIRIGRHTAFFSDAALSMFTRDVLSKTSEDSSSIPQIPLLPTPRFSSRLNYAAKAGLDFQFSNFNLKTAYERIAPNFETMGAYYFNNDIENITVSPNFGFAQNKGRFYGMLGIQKNNLAGSRSETTHRVIGNAVLSVNPSPKFGFEANYMNASVKQRDGRVRLNDSIRVAILNTNIGLTPHWNWTDSLRSRNLLLSLNYQQLNDRNPITRAFADLKTTFATVNYSQQQMSSGWGWSAGLNFNHIEVYQLKNNRYGASAGILKTWAEGLGSASFNATWNRSDINGTADGDLWSGSINLGWTFAKVYSLSVFATVLRNNSKQFEDYTELQGGVTFTRSF